MPWAPWVVQLCSLSLGLGPEGHPCSDHTHTLPSSITQPQRPGHDLGQGDYSIVRLTPVLGLDSVLLKFWADGSGVEELPMETGRNPREAAIPSTGSPTRNNKGFFSSALSR